MERDNLCVFLARVIANELPTVIIGVVRNVENGLPAFEHLTGREHSAADQMAMNPHSRSNRV